MIDCYVTRQGSTTTLTGIISPDLAGEIAVNRSAINPGVTYVVHGTNGHAAWVVATATDGNLTNRREK
jgi:Trk K+ transport system NAD-binding subunit